MKTETILIIMEEPPGPNSQFIEVENLEGRSIRVGEWVLYDKDKGWWALKLQIPKADMFPA